MNDLAAITLEIIAICLGYLVMILVFIYGWGLQPKSWFWIIGVNLMGAIISKGIAEIGKRVAE